MRDVVSRLDAERPVLIAGPTASGKSALATEIAVRKGGIIVNADALQVYADWRILTARPSLEEEARVPHRLYGHVPGDRAYSVGDWLRDVAPLLAGERPILVGGTGLYFTRLTEGLAQIPAIPREVRAACEERAAAGTAALLEEVDAATRRRIDTANPARVRRAWEVLRATGRGLVEWQDATPPPLLPLGAAQAFVVECDRDVLSLRIAERARAMVEAGVVEEVRRTLDRVGPDAPSMKAIGAKALCRHVEGDLQLSEALERLVIATRQYAKRQRTWFRSNMQAWQSITRM